MSCPHVVWALRQRGLTAAERVVLIYLADRANGALLCWPSTPTIAQACELSARTVHTSIQRLDSLGLIRVDRRDGMGNVYHLMRPADDNGPTPAPKTNGAHYNPAPEVIHRTQPVSGEKSAQEQPRVGEKSAPVQDPTPAKSANLAPLTRAKSAPNPPKKESPNLSAQDFSFSDLKASKPAADEAQPTVAEITARRAEHAATLAALPGPLAEALGRLGRTFDKIAPLPGVRPQRTVDEQIGLVTPKPSVRPAYLPAEHLALLRAKTASAAARQPAYA